MIKENYQSNQDLFERKGYCKVTNLFDKNFIYYLHSLCDSYQHDSTFTSFKKNKYNAGIEDFMVQKLLAHPSFIRLMTDLGGKSLIFTDGIIFEIDQRSKGFDWHIGITSFKYIYPENNALTIWIPLNPIDSQGQDGGMSFVSKEIFSGREFYKLQHRVTDSINKKKYCLDRSFANMVGHNRYSGLMARYLQLLRFFAQFMFPNMYSESLYFSSFSRNLLENEREVFNLNIGDAVIFTKDVFHRSNRLKPGSMPSRRAFVLRFIDIDSRYNEINDRVMGTESSQIIKSITVAHQATFNLSKATCLIRQNT